MNRHKSNIDTGRQFYVTDAEHEEGLSVCKDYRELITDDEFININWLCMAYGNDERLDADIYRKAMDAIRKVRESLALA
jgi:hypothetical protein